MADSCRPVSRHGRYNASGPSSVRYTSDVPTYGNVDYTPSDGKVFLIDFSSYRAVEDYRLQLTKTFWPRLANNLDLRTHLIL